MSPVLGVVGPLNGADGLLSLCLILALLYFAFVSWRLGGGRVSLVMLVAGLTYGCFELLDILVHAGVLLFPYTSGGETFWQILRSGSDVVAGCKHAALVVVAVAFLKLALNVRKSRRA